MFNRLAVIATGAAMSILVVIVAFPAQAGGPGSDIVAMGGGYIEEAEFVQGGPRDVTFSFFVGFDRHNEVKGAFQYKTLCQVTGPRLASAPTLRCSKMEPTLVHGCRWTAP
jgi:hypothetical protein